MAPDGIPSVGESINFNPNLVCINKLNSEKISLCNIEALTRGHASYFLFVCTFLIEMHLEPFKLNIIKKKH